MATGSTSSGVPPRPVAPIRPPNLKISPLLKAARYTALVAGIMYGSYRYRKLEKAELSTIQPYENKVKEVRAARLAEETRIRVENEMNSLGKEAGVIPK